MRKRIYRSFLGLALPGILLLSALLSFFFYSFSRNREEESIKDSATLFAGFLNRSGTLPEEALGVAALRMTVVAPDGTVLFESLPGQLENHSDREEIQEAFQNGTGEATRFSDTRKTETYYYAVRLEDGSVLRLSKAVGAISGVFTASLPVIFLVTALILLLANAIARRLTGQIVRPFDTLNLDGENTPVYDELLPYSQKIAEQKREISRQIDALTNRADTIAAIIDNMREGLILLDQNGTVLSANKSVENLFGGIAAKNIQHVCRDLDFQKGVKQCLSGENAAVAYENGGKRYDVYFSPVHGGGAVILFFDTTERHRAERQRREFSANVSHELKTPLTSITALSEMIENGMAKDANIKDFAARISEQAKRLINIITDIIRLSEFDEGGVRQEFTRFNFRELAESAAGALRDNKKNVAIHVEGGDFDITANRRMIDELLFNLIDNGVKYNHDGGSVTVTAALEYRQCRIAVSDTGIGIQPEHHERVFERFYRVDGSRSKKTGGTGLGLSIVKHIAEHHGGRVELESAACAGTTVVCWLPV